ncbi:MAG: VOC family protein [Desulfobacterales bacterium]|nr:MAG: VOC family protein [Desulfobacterales bacterium]
MYKHIDHIALAVQDIEGAADFYRDVFQLDLIMGLSYPPDGVHTNLVFSLGPRNEIEFLGPLGENGFLVEFLRKHGEGFHHLALEVTDLERATSQLAQNGVRIFGGTRHKSMSFTFMHPASTLRVGMQLVQRKPQKPSRNPLIRGIHHVGIRTRSPAKGRDFLIRRLGAEMISDGQDRALDCVGERYRLGEAQFHLLYDFAGPAPGSRAEGLHYVAVKVDDLAQTIEHLKQFAIDPLEGWSDEKSVFLPADKMFGCLWRLIQV